MALADGTQAQNESTTARRRASLVGMPDNAGIEKGRGFERILVEKICTDQTSLRLVQFSMRREGIFHLCGTCIEDVEQISVATFKIFQHVVQLLRRHLGIELQDSVNDVVGARLICRVQVSRFDRRLERSDDDSGWIRAQVESLAIQELRLRQVSSPGSHAMPQREARRR